MKDQIIWYSRCSKCGLWVTHGLHISIEFICAHCLHTDVDLEIDKFLDDPQHKGVPINELFK